MPAPRFTADGVPLHTDDVCVSDGCAREIVLARTTLDSDSWAADVLQRFRQPSVEADFVLFTHRTRTPLVVIALVEVSMAFTEFRGVPYALHLADVATRVLASFILLLALLLTDRATAFAAQRCPKAVIGRTRRAFTHEVLYCLLLIATWLNLVRGVYDKQIRVPCNPALQAVGHPHTCDVVNFGDSLKFLLYLMMAPPRLVALVIVVPVLLALVVVTQTVDVFGPSGAPFFDVSRSELAGRVIIMVLQYAVAVVVTATREKRLREHFITVAAMALANEQRRDVNRQLAALKWVVQASTIAAESAPEAAESNPLTDARGMVVTVDDDGTEMVVAPNVRPHHQRYSNQQLPCVGIAAALWVDLLALPLVDPAQGVSTVFSTESELCEHVEALHSSLLLVERSAAVVAVVVIGDAVCANGQLRLMGDAAEDEALDDDALAVVGFAERLGDAIRRTTVTQPVWHGRLATRAAVAVGTATANIGAARLHPWSEAVASARAAAQSTQALPGTVVAVGEVMAIVQATHTSTSFSMVGDTTLFTLHRRTAHEPEFTSAPGPRPTSVSDAVFASGSGSWDDGDATTARPATNASTAGATSTSIPLSDVEYNELVQESCCGCHRNAVLRAFFPRFARADVEDAFVAHDNENTRKQLACHAGVVILCLVTFAVLLVESQHAAVDIMVVALLCLLATAAIAAVVERICRPLTTAARTAALAGLSTLLMAMFIACLIMEPSSQATRDALMVAAVGITAGNIVLPEHRVGRWVLFLAINFGYDAVIMLRPPPGHDRDARFIWIGSIVDFFISVLATRAARARFADVRQMEALVVAARRAEQRADRELRCLLPPFISAALREAPDDPMHRPFDSRSGLVFICEPDPRVVRALARYSGGNPEGIDDETLLQRHACFVQRLMAMLSTPWVEDVSPLEHALHTAHQHCTALGDALLLVEFDIFGGSAEDTIALETRARRMYCRVQRFFKEYVAHTRKLTERGVHPLGAPSDSTTTTRASTARSTTVVRRPSSQASGAASAADVATDVPEASATDSTRHSAAPTPLQLTVPPTERGVRAVLHSGPVCGSLAGVAPRSFAVVGSAVAHAATFAAAAPYAPQLLITQDVPLQFARDSQVRLRTLCSVAVAVLPM